MNSGPFTNSHTVRAPDNSEGATNHQESALNKLTKIQQIEVLKFAHNHQIRPDDPAWMLVEMLGHFRYTTDTLPARIEAAGNNAVEAINQQRLIEQRAFSANAMKETERMMSVISQKIAEKSDSITQEQLHRRLLINSLMTISCLGVLIAGSAVCGYFIAKGNFYWAVEGEISLSNVFSMVFNLPIGFVILPSFIGGMALMIWQLAVNIKRNDWR